MRQMAHEIVGAELVLGVSAVSLEIGFPAGQLRPPEPGERRVAFHLGDGGAQEDQIGALLDRHHVRFIRRRFSAGVDLPVCLRIHADVVRCERKLPPRRRAVDQGRRNERPGVGWSHQQKLRCGRIDHVDRGNAAVAAVFLGEEQRLFVAVGGEAAARERLAVSQGSHLGVTDGRRLESGRP